jgi:2-polyprenyl-3-methyl-5-hydroxy-6-metoxy-1,4-benzoquinol methylase
MNSEEILRQKQAVIQRFGEWTAHNIQLGPGLYTINEKIAGNEIKLRRLVQIVSDIVDKPFSELRILDLACLEGLYAIEFARHGAEVVGIEGREANIEKARFVKNVLCLDNLELVQDDVRNLSKEKYGSFDVILCLGILYHLDAPDVFSFLETISAVCRKVALIDTHISQRSERSYTYKGKQYWGSLFIEHDAKSTLKERQQALWGSLDNLTSFWPTRHSLYNLISHVGFTSAYECHIPKGQEEHDRILIVAAKGRRQELICCPSINTEPMQDLPEDSGRRIGKFVPRSVKDLIK